MEISPLLRKSGLWLCAVLLLGACGSATSGAAAPQVASVAAGSSHLAAEFIRRPRPAEMLKADGRTYAEKLGADGTFPDTVDGPKGKLAVESLRRAYYVVVAGVLSTGAERDALLDKGLKAFEFGFSQAGADGSFPNERGGVSKKQNSLHPKSEFIEAAASSLLLLQQVELEPRFAARTAALRQQLGRSAQWMANSQDTTDFFGRAKNTNQLMFIATGLQEAGTVTGDKVVIAKARELMEKILARQDADGTFPEKGGFDSNYQTVSLELLGRYAATLPDSPWRDTVILALRKGTTRFLAAVDAGTGTINASANSRTVACGAPVAGSAPKGKDIDIIPLRLHYLGYLLNDEARLGGVADRIQATGQSFTHSEKCGGGKGGKHKRDRDQEAASAAE